MSTPIKSQIQSFVIEAQYIVALEMPPAPGPTATPNQLSRFYYRAKRVLEEIVAMKKTIREIEKAAEEYVNKASATSREQKENAFAEWMNQLNVQQIKLDLTACTGTWTKRVELLEEALDLSDISGSTSTGATENNPVRRMNRPQIKLRQFSGPVEEWIPFWDTFKSLVHNDTSLTKIEKFNLLEGNLEGIAAELIAGITISEDGYDTAIDLLLKKYGDDNKLIRTLNQELMGLPASETVEEDEKLYLRVEKICRQLAALNQNVAAAPYYMSLEGKLSTPVLDKYFSIKDLEDNDDWDTEKFRKAFERALGQIKNRQEAKNTAKLGSFSARKEPKNEATMNFAIRSDQNKSFRERENSFSPVRRSFQGQGTKNYDFKNKERPPFDSGLDRSRDRSPNWKKPYDRNRRGSPYPDRSRSSSGSLDRSRSPYRGKCPFCNESHSPVSCMTYQGAYDRRNRAFVRELCLYCLQKGHFASQCTKPKRRCTFCGKESHHPALCRVKFSKQASPPRSPSPNFKPKSGVSAQTNEKTETSGNCAEMQLFCGHALSDTERKSEIDEHKTASSCIADPTTKMSVLKIISAVVYNPVRPDLKREECVFLYEGCQKTYIEERLANELKVEPIGSRKFRLSGLSELPLDKFHKPIVEFGVRAKKFDMNLKDGTLDKILGGGQQFGQRRRFGQQRPFDRGRGDGKQFGQRRQFGQPRPVDGCRDGGQQFGQRRRFDENRIDEPMPIEARQQRFNVRAQRPFVAGNREHSAIGIPEEIPNADQKEAEPGGSQSFEQKNGQQQYEKGCSKINFPPFVSMAENEPVRWDQDMIEFSKNISVTTHFDGVSKLVADPTNLEAKILAYAAKICGNGEILILKLEEVDMCANFIKEKGQSQSIVFLVSSSLTALKIRWVSENTLEYWPCSPLNITFVPSSNGFCFQKLPVNFTLDSNLVYTGFLDPISLIVLEHAEPGPCSFWQFTTFALEGRISQVNQLNGEVKELKNVDVKSIEVEAWEGKLPNFELQIFKKSALFNLTHKQLDLLELLAPFKSSRILDTRPHLERDRKTWGIEGGVGSIPAQIWQHIDVWKTIVSIISGGLVLRWAYEIWEWKEKKIIHRELKKEQFGVQMANPHQQIHRGPSALLEQPLQHLLHGQAALLPLPTSWQRPSMSTSPVGSVASRLDEEIARHKRKAKKGRKKTRTQK